MQAMHGRLGDPQDYQALQHFITHSPWDATRVWTPLQSAIVPSRIGGSWPSTTPGFPETGDAFGGRAAPALRGAREDRELPGSGVERAHRRGSDLAVDVVTCTCPPRGRTTRPRRTAAGIPETLRFREKWRIVLAHVRTVLKAGFTLTGVVVDADYGSNGAVPCRPGTPRPPLWRRDSRRGRVRGQSVRRVRNPPRPSCSRPRRHAWASVTWGTGTAGPLTARFWCAARMTDEGARGPVVALRTIRER